jgi:hypothetical protein
VATLNLDARGRILGYGDVFADGARTRKALEGMVAEKLAAEEMGEDSFTGLKRPDAFLILPDGIAFVFSRYEAGPGVLGCRKAFLSWKEARPHLRSGGPLALAERPVLRKMEEGKRKGQDPAAQPTK